MTSTTNHNTKVLLDEVKYTLLAAAGTVAAFNINEAATALFSGRRFVLLSNNMDLAIAGGVLYLVSSLTAYLFQKFFDKLSYNDVIARSIVVVQATRVVLIPAKIALTIAEGGGVFAAVVLTTTLAQKYFH